MAKAFVYCILAALFITVHSATALFANIHKNMTKAEKLTVFGSEHLDPDYQVFPMSLTGMKRRRKSKENIKCTLNLNGKKIKLNLRPTPQYLATKYVPVWSAVSDRHAYKNIRYKPLSTAMSDIGDFTMYQDAKNEAALAVYTDHTEKIVIEGIITSRYTIRSLPKRFSRNLLNEMDDVTKISNAMGGTITSDKDAGFYVVTKDPDAPVSTTDRTFLESHESANPTEHENNVKPGHHEEGITVPTTVRTILTTHKSVKPTEPAINAEPGHHEEGTTTHTTVPTLHGNHESTKPTDHQNNAEPGHHEEGTMAPTAVPTHPESHEPAKPTEPAIKAEPEHHEEGATTLVTVPIHLESHEMAHHENNAEPGHHEEETTVPTTVPTHPESHESAEPTKHENNAEPEHHEEGTTTLVTVPIHLESHESAEPTKHENNAEPGHHEEGMKVPTTVPTHLENHESAETTEHENNAEPGHHEEGMKVPTTVPTLLENHESAEPTEHENNAEPGHHEEGMKVPTTVPTLLENHESAEPTEHENNAEPGHLEEGTTVPTTVPTHPESHESAEPTEHENNAEPGHHDEGTTVPTTVPTHPESHESAEPTEHENNAEPGHHEEGTKVPTTVPTHPESHESAEPTEHENNAEPGHHEEGTKVPTTVPKLLENHESAEPTEHEDNAESEHHERKKRAKDNESKRKVKKKAKVPKTVYSEMLIVLDHNAIRHGTITRTLRRTLAFWNAVDLIYSTLDKPKMHLNVAGVIIAADDMATPYIAKNTSVSSIGNLDSVLTKMGKYFYKESVRFPINQYDTIIAMTTVNLCAGEVDSCENSAFIPGHTNGLAVCSSESDIKKTKTLKNTMIMHYDEKFGPEHLSFVHHGDGYEKNNDCVSKTHNTTDNNRSFEWSKCSRKLLSRSLTSKKTECLRNKPLSIKPVDKVLPGRWLSMDGQCQNEGYAESCKLKKKVKTCVAKGCRAKDSKKCVTSKKVPLPGSECETDKYCNEKKVCVRK